MAVLWLLIAAVAVLAPALIRGTSLGPFDMLSQFGLSKRSGVVIHNRHVGDQIDAIIPWTTLAWRQIHEGNLPLWNPFSGLGMPLAFNWQSAVFSAPSLIGYLFPVRLAYTVQVVLTLLIAGTGVYVLGRVLRLGVLACVFAATVYELSGPVMGWLGWPHSAVMSWAGWLFAAGILITRGGHRARDVTFFAVVVAFAVYAGQPEILFLLGVALGVFLLVHLALEARASGGLRSIRRPVVDLSIATTAGFALAAPLALPALQLVGASVRNDLPGDRALPPNTLTHLVFQGFHGLPIAGNDWFGYAFYPSTAAYVGVIGLVLAAVGVALRRARREVIAFTAVALATAAIVFVPPLVLLLNELPSVGAVAWHRALIPLAFALAVLSGFGIDALVRGQGRRILRYWAGGAFAAAGVALLVLFVVGRGDLPATQASIRARSFVWPVVQTAVGLAVVGFLVVMHRSGRRELTLAGRIRLSVGQWAAVSLLVCETAFLVAAGMPLWSSSPDFYPQTRAEASLQRAVGSSVVAMGAGNCFLPPYLGYPINVNIVHGVQQFAIYDPMTPQLYFDAWTVNEGTPSGVPSWSFFCPAVTSAAQGRRYGVEYVLEPGGAPGPDDATFVKRVGDEDLYRIPDAAVATLVPIRPSGALPAAEARGTPVAVRHPSPRSWRLVTDSARPAVLRLRLPDLPGWHATIDDRPLTLQPFSHLMLQARIPPGRHTVEVSYWPKAFTAGIILAACSAIGLSVALVVARARRRSRSSPAPVPPGGVTS